MGTRREAVDRLHASLESYARLYQFRDVNDPCLFDLRVNECYVLEFVIERAPISVSEVAIGMRIHKSNASRIIGSLQEAGYLTATADHDDARRMQLRPTRKGHCKIGDVKSYLISRLERTLTTCKTSEIEMVANVMRQLTLDAKSRMSRQCE